MGAFADLSGQVYERLTVLECVGRKNHMSLWRCRCSCGNEILVTVGSLRSGNTRSCGCIHREQLAKRNRQNALHHDSDSRLFGVWNSMKQRCYNPNRKEFKDYGGRGISVCQEWKDNYLSFKNWAFAHGYDSEAPQGVCTLDRIDVDKNYSPDNCRWVDAKAQATNRRPRNIRRNANGTFQRKN